MLIRVESSGAAGGIFLSLEVNRLFDVVVGNDNSSLKAETSDFFVGPDIAKGDGAFADVSVEISSDIDDATELVSVAGFLDATGFGDALRSVSSIISKTFLNINKSKK
jgi:hypothetical protein